jgi:hypothetical protein
MESTTHDDRTGELPTDSGRDFATSPEMLVDAAYELISFGPGSDPSWQAFRRLFAEPCVLALRLFPDDPSISVLSIDDYMREQVREGMREEGYVERPLERDFSRTGDMAAATVRFEMVFGVDRKYLGVDQFQMVKRAGRWWIVSISGEILRPADPGTPST